MQCWSEIQFSCWGFGHSGKFPSGSKCIEMKWYECWFHLIWPFQKLMKLHKTDTLHLVLVCIPSPGLETHNSGDGDLAQFHGFAYSHDRSQRIRIPINYRCDMAMNQDWTETKGILGYLEKIEKVTKASGWLLYCQPLLFAGGPNSWLVSGTPIACARRFLQSKDLLNRCAKRGRKFLGKFPRILIARRALGNSVGRKIFLCPAVKLVNITGE